MSVNIIICVSAYLKCIRPDISDPHKEAQNFGDHFSLQATDYEVTDMASLAE